MAYGKEPWPGFKSNPKNSKYRIFSDLQQTFLWIVLPVSMTVIGSCALKYAKVFYRKADTYKYKV